MKKKKLLHASLILYCRTVNTFCTLLIPLHCRKFKWSSLILPSVSFLVGDVDATITRRLQYYPCFEFRFLLPQGERYRLCHFLPKKSGCGILYTSRNKICATRLTSRYGPSKLVIVDRMPDTDAMAMIENGLKGHLTDEYLECMKGLTKQLALALDMLPLAIVQAVAMMRENVEASDPKTYLELYNQVQDEQGNFLKEEFFDWRRDSDLPNPMFFSWKMSFELLRKREENVVLLLSLFSVLDRQGIPEWLLAFCPEISRYSRTKALNLLHAFSFISPRLDKLASKKWQMHRLVQLATHARIGRQGLEKALQKALRMLADAFIGHIYRIEDGDLRVAKSLEYYPHAKSVLSLLGALGFNNRGRLVQTAVRSFADQFEDESQSAGLNLTWAVEFISQSDFSSLSRASGTLWRASNAAVVPGSGSMAFTR